MKVSAFFRRAGLAAFFAELALSLIAGALCALTRATVPAVYWITRYFALPLLGSLIVYRAVRRGINPYIAFPVPSFAWVAAAWAIWGMLPDPGSAIICFFVCLVGSAAGDVKNREGKKQ